LTFDGGLGCVVGGVCGLGGGAGGTGSGAGGAPGAVAGGGGGVTGWVLHAASSSAAHIKVGATVVRAKAFRKFGMNLGSGAKRVKL
jgi:hypothetical protein